MSPVTNDALTTGARRDEWIAAGVFERLHQLALEAYDEAIGLDLENLVVDGCIVKAPWRWPEHRAQPC